MDYLLAIDQGSSYSKAALMTRRGRLVHIASVPLRAFRPRPRWVEHHPEEILKSSIRAAQACLRKIGRSRSGLAGIALTGQRSTILVWDKTSGRPLSPALSWQDLRAAEETRRFSEYRELIRSKTGLLLSPHYSALKLRWILEHVPRARAMASAGRLLCGTVTTYLLWHLTRGELHAIDPTHAARLLLMNLHTLDWDPELIELFGIPDSMLPRILPTVSDFGTVRMGGRTASVLACIGDQQAALVGLGAVHPGEAIINYGTGGFLLVNAGPTPVRPPGLLSSLAWVTPTERAYVVEGTVNAVGSVFDWLAKIGWMKSKKETDRLPDPEGERIYFVPALTGLGAPYWESGVRMGLLGIGPTTTRTDLVRSAVEGIAFLMKDIEEALRRDGRLRIQKLTASGGGSRIRFLVQTQADCLGIPIRLSSETEATAKGAALLAGVGCGWWSSPSDLPRPDTGRVFRPRLAEPERKRLYQSWQKAIEVVRRFSSE